MELLKNRGLKATPQRLSVLKILDSHTHPTIDELYDEICAENPSVSLATVYKNLNMLKDEGLVVEVNMPTKKCATTYLAARISTSYARVADAWRTMIFARR